MLRCRCVLPKDAEKEALQHGVIALDYDKFTRFDLACIPVALLDIARKKNDSVTIVLHASGQCTKKDVAHEKLEVKASSISTRGISHAAGYTLFSGMTLSEPCYVVNKHTLGVETLTRCDIRIPQVNENSRSERVVVSRLPYAYPASCVDRWFREKPASLAEAEESLRVYCSALCSMAYADGIASRGDSGWAECDASKKLSLEVLDKMTERSEFLGWLLFRCAVVNSIENKQMRAAMVRADKYATDVRTKAYLDKSTWKDIDVVIRRISDGSSTPLAVTAVGASHFESVCIEYNMEDGGYNTCLGGLMYDYIKYRDNEKYDGAIYCCEFEDCVGVLQPDKYVLHAGKAFVSPKEAWSIMRNSRCVKTASRVICMEDAIYLNLPFAYAVNGVKSEIADACKKWILSIGTLIDEKSCDIITDTACSVGPGALLNGPLCSLALSDKLSSKGHLLFNERRQMLAMLVDSGVNPTSAVDYIFGKMNTEARKRCCITQLRSHLSLGILVRDERAIESATTRTFENPHHVVYSPASHTCSKLVYSGRLDNDSQSVHGCPYTFMDVKTKSRLLSRQGLSAIDIEDIDRCNTRTRYKSACAAHYAKLVAARGPNCKSLDPGKLVLQCYQSFIKALFREEKDDKNVLQQQKQDKVV